MKIIHMIDRFDDSDGCARYVFLLGREQRRRGHSVSLIVGTGSALTLLEHEGIGHYVLPDIAHEERSIMGYLKGMVAVNKIVNAVDPDIVHTHHYYAANIFRSFPRSHRPAHVHTVHQSIPAGRLKMFIGDSVVAVSESIRDHVYRIDPSLFGEVTVVHSGSEFLEPPAGSEAETLVNEIEAHHREAYTVGYVGRLTEVKGVGILLRALGRLSDTLPLHCIIVGDGPERSALEQLSRTLHVKATFTGAIRFVREYMEMMDIVVLPSLSSEGLPMTILEAGMCNKAVVATRQGGVPDIIRDGETGSLVEPGDVDALAEAIRKLAIDVDKRNAMANKLHSTVTAHYSVTGMTDAMEQIYLTTMTGRT